MSNEFEGKYAEKKKTPLKPFYPVIGLLIAAIAAVGAYFVAEPAFSAVQPTLFADVAVPNDPIIIAGQELFPNGLVFATAFVVWLSIIALFAAAFAIFQPSQNLKLVDEKTLKAEKEDKIMQQKRAERRRKAMKAKMRKANQDFTEV